ncbi:hypothetical protein [Botrimarina hoheduenensis]|uniref:Uncharacterized protein n=1 Tax=Botrimarina hoheduenensis TaxID=2528000 RepID=A0A5C5WCU4_9BACT|nr:hypothetical protein [Botrimarina hoheduenensis]TWT48748.1 hypothetical protein Pla111_05230 [Botrimarina hoheduenensis]
MRLATATTRFCAQQLPIGLLLIAFACSASAESATPPLRLRMSFASAEPQLWSGAISTSPGQIANEQPLSTDPLHVGSLWIEKGVLQMAYRHPARRGVVDFDAAAPRDGVVRLSLNTGPTVRETEFSLAELARGKPLQRQIDGTSVTIQRAPSDRLRIEWPSATRFFAPLETCEYRVSVDPPSQTKPTPLELTAVLRRLDEEEPVWRSDPIRFEPRINQPTTHAIKAVLPREEGIYEFHLQVQKPAGFSRRFFPHGDPPPLVERRFQVLVFDRDHPPTAPPSDLTAWRVVQDVDFAEGRLRDRLPDWAAWRRSGWTGQEAAPTDALPPAEAGFELPAATEPGVATWRGVPLALPTNNLPCLVEVTLPAGSEQLVGLCFVEPDSGGTNTLSGRPVVAAPTSWTTGEAGVCIARWLSWPRTREPLLVVSNPSVEQGARILAIRVRQPPEPDKRSTAQDLANSNDKHRQVLLDLRSNDLLADFGVPLARDEPSGVTYADLRSAWTAARRIADLVEFQGATGAVVAINPRGAPIYTSDVLGLTPTHDREVWFDGAADLPRQPFLPLLLGEFERRGLLLTPALNLAGPLPRLERMALHDPESVLVQPTGTDPTLYHPLSPIVADEAAAALQELLDRHRDSAALGGVALTLDERSPLLLNDGDRTGIDRACVDRFLASIGARWPANEPRSRESHAAILREKEGQRWNLWQHQQLATLHARLDAIAAGQADTDRSVPLIRLVDRVALAAASVSPLVEPTGESVSSLPSLTGLGLDASAAIPNIARLIGIAPPRPLRLLAETIALRQFSDGLASNSSAASLVSPTLSYRIAGVGSSNAVGAAGVELTVSAPVETAGSNAVGLSSTLAGGLPRILIEAGPAANGWADEAATRTRRLVASMPLSTADSPPATVVEDSVAVIVCPEPAGAMVVAINRGPWPQRARLSINAATRCRVSPWSAGSAIAADRAGDEWCRPGGHVLDIQLDPHSSAAWSFSSKNVSLTGLRLETAPEAAAALRQTLDQLNNRDRSARRPYPRLANASFETLDANGNLIGWANESGSLVWPSTRPSAAYDGSSVLRLTANSNDSSAASDWYPAPATGQFALVLQARGEGLEESATMRIDFQLRDGATTTRTLQGTDLYDQWREVVFAVDDLPLDERPMRVRFSLLAEQGMVEIDSLEAEDLMLPLDYYAEETRGQKFALVRMTHAAEAALAEGRLDDCRRLLDGYWPRFVLQNFPASAKPAESLAAPKTPADPVEKEAAEAAPSVAERVREYLPRWWR